MFISNLPATAHAVAGANESFKVDLIVGIVKVFGIR